MKMKEVKLGTVLNWIPNIKRLMPVEIKKYTVENGTKYPFYGQQLLNNGIINYIAVAGQFLNNLECNVYLLIASNNHSINIVTTPFYIKEDHAATSVIGHPKMSLMSALYIKGSIQKVFDTSFDYNAKALQGILQNTLITLPFVDDKSNELDWEYMENKSLEIKEKEITKIKKYLSEHGFSESIKESNDEKIINELSNSIYKGFSIEKLFSINTPRKKFNAQSIQFGIKGYNYVTRSSENNGIRGKTIQNDKYLNCGNTISFGQDTATIFYQKEPYFTGDKVKILIPKFEGFNDKNALFFITAMRKSFQTFMWGSSSFDVEILKKVEIQLPVDAREKINLKLMEAYILIIEKKVLNKLNDNLSSL